MYERHKAPSSDLEALPALHLGREGAVPKRMGLRQGTHAQVLHFTLLDGEGKVTALNGPAPAFATLEPKPTVLMPVLGENLLEACRQAGAKGDAVAREAAEGISAVLAARLPLFTLEYACDDQGAQRWFVLEVTPLQGAVGVAVAHQEVTNQRVIEQTVANFALRYWTVSEQATDYAYEIAVHPDGMPAMQWVTEAFTRATGFTAIDLHDAQGWEQLIHPDDQRLVREHYGRLLAGQEDLAEFRVLTRNGQVRWLRDQARPVWDGAAGRVVALTGAAQDVTEQRNTLDDLEQHRLRLQALFDHTLDAILLADDAGRIVDANPAACGLLGHTRAHLVRQYLWELPDTADERSFTAWQAFMSTGRQRGEYRVSRPNGEPIDVEFRSVAHILPGLHLSVLRDITERHEAEEKLRYRLELERTISAISSHLLTRHVDLDYVVSALGEAVGVNRTYLFRFHEDAPLMDNTHEWCKAGTEPQIENLQGLPMSIFPWWMEKMHRAEVLVVPDVDGLPAEIGAEREILQSQQIKALLVMPIRLQNGRIYGFIGLDDTEQCRNWVEEDVHLMRVVGNLLAGYFSSLEAEAALRESEGFLESVFQNLPTGVFVKEARSLRFVRVNRALEELLGRTTEDMVGKNDHDFFPLEEAAAFMETDRQALAGRQLVDIPEEAVHTSSQDTRVLHTRKIPIFDQHDEPRFLLGICEDITERKEAEAALAESEERWRMLVDNHPEPILVSVRGNIVLANRAASMLSGHVTLNDFLGQSLLDFVSAEESDRLQKRLVRVARGEELPPEEYLLILLDGSERYVEVLSVPVLFEGQRAVQTVLRDVTERRRYEEGLIAAKEEAERVSRLRSTILANMSHEIRTPLTTVLGFAEVLAEEIEGPQSELVELITRGAKRLSQTLNSVLDLARLDSGSLALHPEAINVANKISELVDNLRPHFDDKAVALELVSMQEDIVAHLDPGVLGRVVENLVNNAIKFTDAGTVTVRVSACHDWVRLQVQDTGIGIAPEFMPHLFDEFEQESSGLARSYEGSGLGLAITKRLLDFVGGTIEVESVKGQGSLFTVNLPRYMALDVRSAA